MCIHTTTAYASLRAGFVPRPHHAHARKGSGDIGADSWFCKLSNHVTIKFAYIFFLLLMYVQLALHVQAQSHDGVQDKENTPVFPRPFSLLEDGVWPGEQDYLQASLLQWSMLHYYSLAKSSHVSHMHTWQKLKPLIGAMQLRNGSCFYHYQWHVY